MHAPPLRRRAPISRLFPLTALLLGSLAWGQQTTDQRIQALETQLKTLQRQAEKPEGGSKLRLGGYGEFHVNVVESDGKDQADFHRAVLYLGYDFTDWISLNSETEIEHAFVEGGDGEVAIEQLYLDFRAGERLNYRVGRVLAPLGIINQRHEPPIFNGVERPLVDTVIIPTTWAVDGAGIYGTLSDHWKYEAYLSNGLDGSQFHALDGWRKGRMKERPGLSQLAVSGRLDVFPLATADLATPQSLRLGAAFFGGGVDNANKGGESNIDARVALYIADADYSIGPIDLRGEYAYGTVDGAQTIGPTVASAIKGWYLEGAWHWWPAGWQVGKLQEADAVLFVRFDAADTQEKLPAGGVKNLAGDRTETTVGINFYPTRNVVLKADYQFKGDATAVAVNDQFNLGVGWAF
jgi:hypothetical protein